MGKILSNGASNAKTKKNFAETHIFYGSSSTENSYGIDMCPMASLGCRQACLVNKGRGRMSNVKLARIAKTDEFLRDKTAWSEKLYKELTLLNKKATRKNSKIAVRLNGTTDQDFIAIVNRRLGVDVLSDFQRLVFYDYTKIPGKVMKYAHRSDRYRLTFSRSEDLSNQDAIPDMIRHKAPIAVVFGITSKSKQPLPKEYLGLEVVDGDERDDIMLDRYGESYILGLRYKGSKKEMLKDIEKGFVVKI